MGEKNERLSMERYFTRDIPSRVYDSVAWEKTNIGITDEGTGKVLFTQKDAEFPSTWSHLARKIVSSKYLYGEQNTDKRETGAKQLISRVTDKFGEWAKKDGYFSSDAEVEAFRDELAYLTLHQKLSFNSPVWFNVGVDKYAHETRNEQKEAYIIKNNKVVKIPKGKDREYPQTSACFIQHVDDTMEDIMQLATNEALLFKYGSGTGSDLSTLRSSYEKLSGGGKPSGPLAYWKFYDVVAGIVKSGGKTRRAAKMDSLKDWHPDIMHFIKSKRREEEKARILQDGGVNPIEASETVAYQNTNISVRLSDRFMNAYEKDEEWQTTPVHSKDEAKKMPKFPAKKMLNAIAEGTHYCGDPGVQFDDIINRWHTCPESGRINASNPCSEYMFIDDSSCNLASLNVKAFVKKDGSFDIDGFSQAVRVTAIAQDLEFDNSSFPTRKIAKNSHAFRPLGMGYANVGSLIMERGLAYDSDEARAIAASITALQTGLVYLTSTEMAEKLGTFEEYNKNKKPMLEVIKMHKTSLCKIDRTKLGSLEAVLDSAERVWKKVEEHGRKYGFRNAQATVLAPTGTIGFMMDCDTKGVEPEIGLVQTKLLSDGGTLRLVNGSVAPALRKLGYQESQVKEMIEYVQGHGNVFGAPHLKEEDKKALAEHEKSKDIKKLAEPEFLKEKGYNSEQIVEIIDYKYGRMTMEGAPHLREEHLPIFDCSNKPKRGKRTISTYGHLEMMAAVQPFLSGAISKTVNMPKDATVEQIEEAYVHAWKLGLKAVAIYRDGSKIYQPLTFAEREEKKRKEVGPVRRKLPTTRPSITHKFAIGGYGKDAHEGYLTLGFHPEDGSLGEMFTTMAKEGSTVSGLLDGIATLASLCYQYGVPPEKLAEKFSNAKFEPRGIVSQGRDDMKTTNSITEYVFNAAVKFAEERKKAMREGKTILVSNGNVEESKKSDILKESEEKEEKGGFCPVCSRQMDKKGHCLEKCVCGYEDPKGCGK